MFYSELSRIFFLGWRTIQNISIHFEEEGSKKTLLNILEVLDITSLDIMRLKKNNHNLKNCPRKKRGGSSVR